jgi:hypothetical protein
MIFSQKWHHTPVKRIKLRQVASHSSAMGETEELFIIYQDRKVVCIEGNSLWIAIRNLKNEGGIPTLSFSDWISNIPNEATANAPSAESLSVSYRKWDFSSQYELSDVAILGIIIRYLD